MADPWPREPIAAITNSKILQACRNVTDDENIGWTRISYGLPVTGTYTLQFTISDGAGSFESILGIDSVTVSPIPAPAAILLGTFGAGLVGWMRRRRVV